MTETLTKPLPSQRPYEPRGGAYDLMFCRDTEVLMEGPAGTGKSRGVLEKVFLCAQKYQGMRALVTRKTRESLTESGLVTLEDQVLPLGHPATSGAARRTRNSYEIGRSSIVVMGLTASGKDQRAKVMSTEYDMIVVLEGTEISEHDWEQLLSRLRNGVMPYQQAIADVNPDAPTHWLNRRASAGQMTRILSRHEDNPRWFTRDGKLTAAGTRYIATLDRLTGVRHLRLRKGVWAAAEGMVYDGWDADIHLIDRFEIPADWRRIRVIDFGYTNPFVCQWWAIDGDGRMYLYRELYGTKTLVAKWATEIIALSAGEIIEANIADHDAEDRATLHAAGIQTIAAMKDVTTGIQATQNRMQKAEDGKARLFILRDSLVMRDPLLVDSKKPACTVEEVEGYVWPKGQDGKSLKEVPVKENDHGMDTMRYGVAYVDQINSVPFEFSIGGGEPAVGRDSEAPAPADWLRNESWSTL